MIELGFTVPRWPQIITNFTEFFNEFYFFYFLTRVTKCYLIIIRFYIFKFYRLTFTLLLSK